MSSVTTHFDHPASVSPPSQRHALEPGTRFGEFEIFRVLGVGGFGIVYLARDHALQRNVALKEYMPASLAARGVGARVTIRSPSFAQTYASGLEAFISEARLLAHFDHPSLVKVHRCWEDNGSAYMVMPYLKGVMLGDTRRAMSSPPDEAWLRRVVDAILAALEVLHREGVYHRDVAPENILLPRDGPAVLLDFGAARHAIGNTQSFTTMLRLDYAPIEQFVGVKPLHQGPWTDLYALGAVMHFLVFGVPPAPATERAVQGDDGEAIANRSAAGISPHLLEVIAWALAVRPNRRPQTARELRAALDGRIAVPAFARRNLAPVAVVAPAPADDAPEPEARERVIPMKVQPILFKGTRIHWPYLPELLRVLWSKTATASPGVSDTPPASTLFLPPPPLLSPTSAAQGARMAPGLVLALLGLLVVAVAVVGWTAKSLGDVGVVSVPGPVPIVAHTSPDPPTLVEPLDTAAGKAMASPPAAPAVVAAAEPPVVATTVMSSRALKRVHAAVRAKPHSALSVHASARSGASARRAGPHDRKLAKAPAKRSLSPAAVAVTRPKPDTADVYVVTSNAYTERSADAAILNERGRGPVSPGWPETPHGISVAEPPGSSSVHIAQNPASAREACRGRGFFSRTVCIDRECEQPRFRDSAECGRVLAMKRARESR